MLAQCSQVRLAAPGHSAPRRVQSRRSADLQRACHALLPEAQSRCVKCQAASVLPANLSPAADGYDGSQKWLAVICKAMAVAAAAVLWTSVATGSGGAPLFASVAQVGSGAGKGLVISSAGAGLAAGFLHTLCGPDHLAALTPLTIGRNRFAAALLGSLWGLGHSTGQMFIGVAFAVLKEQFTELVPFLSKWAGKIVALTLMAIGTHGLFETFGAGGEEDGHDDEEKLREITGVSSGVVKSDSKILFATFITGILYGLQPDSLFVVLPALALPKLAAFGYCVMFVIGTVVAMGGYTFFIGTASQELCRDRPQLQRNLSVIASAIAIVVGVLLLLSGFGVDVPLFN